MTRAGQAHREGENEMPIQDETEGGVKAGLGEGDHFVTLSRLKSGYAEKLFQHALQQVMANIADPNTDAEARRSITIQIDFKPEADRRECKVRISSRSKLASVQPEATTVYTGRHKNKLVMVESNPEQRGLFTNVPDIQPVAAAGGTAPKGAQI